MALSDNSYQGQLMPFCTCSNPLKVLLWMHLFLCIVVSFYHRILCMLSLWWVLWLYQIGSGISCSIDIQSSWMLFCIVFHILLLSMVKICWGSSIFLETLVYSSLMMACLLMLQLSRVWSYHRPSNNFPPKLNIGICEMAFVSIKLYIFFFTYLQHSVWCSVIVNTVAVIVNN